MKRAPTFPMVEGNRGFTLLELMVTISILAILLAVAVPSFTSTIRSNQISTTANDLVGALGLARSEASKRGVNVTLCASNSSNTGCSGGASWANGWLIFSDTCVMGSIDCTDAILTRSSVVSSGVTVTGSDATITYMPTGELAAPAVDSTFTMTKSGATCSEIRIITVQASTGRNKLQKGNCP